MWRMKICSEPKIGETRESSDHSFFKSAVCCFRKHREAYEKRKIRVVEFIIRGLKVWLL